jgi:hypothetical protein
MSFLLELEVEGLTEEQGRAVETKCRERRAWPVRFVLQRRRRFALIGPRGAGPALRMPENVGDRHLLSDAAEWEAPAWAMEPELLPAFAEAVRVLGDELPQGFALRATWVGSEVREERVLSADELAELVLASQLNEFTRYRVAAPAAASGDVSPRAAERV